MKKFIQICRRSLAVKLMLAFILVAVPPMLIASQIAAYIVSSAANMNIENWLHSATRYLGFVLEETLEEFDAVYTILKKRFEKNDFVLSREELDALGSLSVDCVVLKDADGKVLYSTAEIYNIDQEPLFPGSPFRWALFPDGRKELAFLVNREFRAKDGSKRSMDLIGWFIIQLAESKEREPFELRILLPEGAGFRQVYSSAGSAPYVIPEKALKELHSGADNVFIPDKDWTDDSREAHFLLTPLRDAQKNIKAVFITSAAMLSQENKLVSTSTLFFSFFILGTLLSGGIGYLLSRHLVRPMKKLNEGVKSIAAGDLTYRVDVAGQDEVAELGTHFNLMAKQLEAMQREGIQSARQERSRMLGEIALGFAHEIRNPLVVIKTSADLVHSTLPAEAKEARMMNFVIEEVARIDSLVSKFLAFAKPAPLKLEYFDLNALVRNVLEMCQAQLDKHGISLDLALEAENGQVLAEQKQIHQALLNLVLNAVDAMPEGGSLGIRVYESAGRICLAVSDTGVGISEAMLPRIHLPFISTKKNGLGLGLAKVYATVEEHGGTVMCTSKEGQGSVFTICLNK